MRKKLSYSVIYAPARDGGYAAYFPAFPEITVWYPTLAECRRAARGAPEVHLEGLLGLGERPPLDKPITRATVRIEVG
jgi:predicted RNase H-like HicB family nuclease